LTALVGGPAASAVRDATPPSGPTGSFGRRHNAADAASASEASSPGLGPPHGRAFDVDILACPRCGGRLRLIAIVEDPREIRQVLAGLVHSAEPVDRAPPSYQSFDVRRAADVLA